MSTRDAEDPEFAELTLENAELYLNDFMRMLWRSANTARENLRKEFVTQEHYDLRVWHVCDFDVARISFRHGRFHHALCYIDDRIAHLHVLLQGDIPETSMPFVRSEYLRAKMWHQYLKGYI